jgi:hypothetical protein
MKMLYLFSVIVALTTVSFCSKEAPGPMEQKLSQITKQNGNPADLVITDENRSSYTAVLKELFSMLSLYDYTHPLDQKNKYKTLYKASLYASALAMQIGYKNEAGLIYLNALLIEPENALKDVSVLIKKDGSDTEFYRQIIIPEYKVISEKAETDKNGTHSEITVDIKKHQSDILLNAITGHILFAKKHKDENLASINFLLTVNKSSIARATWDKSNDTMTLDRL